MVLQLIQPGLKMILKWFQMLPPPIPIPGASKSLLPGGKTIRKNIFLMIFYDFYEKGSKKVALAGIV